MMLDWLGERHNDPRATQAAQRIDAAVARVLAEGRTLTPDLGGRAGTRAVGEAVRRALEVEG
jgi:3-isopropylmalate dehydrogenase